MRHWEFASNFYNLYNQAAPPSPPTALVIMYNPPLLKIHTYDRESETIQNLRCVAADSKVITATESKVKTAAKSNAKTNTNSPLKPTEERPKTPTESNLKTENLRFIRKILISSNALSSKLWVP